MPAGLGVIQDMSLWLALVPVEGPILITLLLQAHKPGWTATWVPTGSPRHPTITRLTGLFTSGAGRATGISVSTEILLPDAGKTAQPGGNCANALFVVNSDLWTTTDMPYLWTNPKATNDPCPTGYRVPSQAELSTLQIWVASNYAPGYSAGFYSSPLKMLLAGNRDYTSYANVSGGGSGYVYYWSSTYANFSRAVTMYFSSINSGMIVNGWQRANGFPVRCIAQ
jgi:uncharacterized protein (TIGR02145 family)